MKKPFYKRAWFIILAIVIVVIGVIIGIIIATGGQKKSKSKYGWPDNTFTSMLPRPDSPYGELREDNENQLSVSVYTITRAQFEDYIEKCKEKGFTIDSSSGDDHYTAKNQYGFSLSLDFTDLLDGKMEIDLVPGEAVTENEGEEYKNEKYEWPENGLSNMILQPPSPYGKIIENSESKFEIVVYGISISQQRDYGEECEVKGFDEYVQHSGSSWSNKNKDGYLIEFYYREDVNGGELRIILNAPQKNG